MALRPKLFEGNLLWVSQYAPPPPNLHIERGTNPILIKLDTILKQPI